MNKNDSNSRHKRNWWDITAQIIGILGFLVAITTFYLNYQVTIVANEIRANRLLDQAWDYIGGIEGKPREGTTIFHVEAKRDRRNLAIAYRMIRDAMLIDPKNTRAIEMKGVYLEYMGKLDEAISAFRETIELDSLAQNAYVNLGTALEKKGEDSAAIDAFEKALELDSSDIVVLNNLGFLHSKQGRHVDAIKLFRDAIQIDPEISAPYVNLGNVLRLIGRSNEAAEVYNDGIQVISDDGLLYFCYSMALAELGRTEESEQAKKKARSLGWMLNSCGY